MANGGAPAWRRPGRALSASTTPAPGRGPLAETPPPRPGARWWTAASVALLLAGLVHFILVDHHFSEAQAHGLFFLAIACAQCGCAFALGRHRSTLLLHAANGAALVSLAVYAASRVVPAPFADAAEGVDGYGIVAKALELAAAVAVSRLLAAQPAARWERFTAGPVRRVVASLVVALLVAALVLGAGYALEGVAPGLGDAGGHGQAHAH